MNKLPQILILSPIENDPQSVILYEEIFNQGGNPILLPFKAFSESKALDIFINDNQTTLDSDLSNVKSVFVRGISTDLPLEIPPYLSELDYLKWKAKYISENYKINTINLLLKMLELNGALIINPLMSYFQHNTKVQFNIMLRKKAVHVPATFGTNSLEFLKKKYDEDSELIIKSPSGVGATRKLSGVHLKQSKALLYTPALFQELIKGNTYRIHTVGDKVVLSLRIFAEDIDSRSDTSGFEVVELNAKHKSQVIKANKILGWKFSAWDAIINQDNEIYLLDGNPGPYIYWIGSYFTRYVMKCFAQYLVNFTSTGSLLSANRAVKPTKLQIQRIYKIDEEINSKYQPISNDWKKDLNFRH
jgi:hypothetical protein